MTLSMSISIWMSHRPIRQSPCLFPQNLPVHRPSPLVVNANPSFRLLRPKVLKSPVTTLPSSATADPVPCTLNVCLTTSHHQHRHCPGLRSTLPRVSVQKPEWPRQAPGPPLLSSPPPPPRLLCPNHSSSLRVPLVASPLPLCFGTSGSSA